MLLLSDSGKSVGLIHLTNKMGNYPLHGAVRLLFLCISVAVLRTSVSIFGKALKMQVKESSSFIRAEM